MPVNDKAILQFDYFTLKNRTERFRLQEQTGF